MDTMKFEHDTKTAEVRIKKEGLKDKMLVGDRIILVFEDGTVYDIEFRSSRTASNRYYHNLMWVDKDADIIYFSDAYSVTLRKIG